MPKIYLMKSEPHVFSITDLQNSESQTSPWDGKHYQILLLTTYFIVIKIRGTKF